MPIKWQKNVSTTKSSVLLLWYVLSGFAEFKSCNTKTISAKNTIIKLSVEKLSIDQNRTEISNFLLQLYVKQSYMNREWIINAKIISINFFFCPFSICSFTTRKRYWSWHLCRICWFRTVCNYCARPVTNVIKIILFLFYFLSMKNSFLQRIHLFIGMSVNLHWALA